MQTVLTTVPSFRLRFDKGEDGQEEVSGNVMQSENGSAPSGCLTLAQNRKIMEQSHTEFGD